MSGRQLALKLGLRDSEYDTICELMGRKPNETELGMFAALWSEHCAYKHSRHLFSLFPTDGEHVLQGVGENAGVVDVGGGMAVTFKVESHNSPSAVQPFHGAATGVGGILRDIISMGARPIALLGALRMGSLQDEKARAIFKGVTEGMTDYGNHVGVPVVGGEVHFDEAFQHNPLVNVMAIGLVHHDHVATAHAHGVGNDCIVAGRPTGRDGIMGAGFSSVDLAEAQAPDQTQTGDPFAARRLVEASLEIIAKDLVAGMQDMGAAGLTSSAAEMAAKAGTGLEIDVSRVPRKEPGMTPYEVMLSESQERMLIVAKPDCSTAIIEVFQRHGLDAQIIGKVTDDGRLRVLDGEHVAADIEARHLADDAPSYVPAFIEPEYVNALAAQSGGFDDVTGDVTDTFLTLLQHPSLASKAWLFRQGDYMSGGRTVTAPETHAASVVRLTDEGKGIGATVYANSLHSYMAPYEAGMAAVAQAALHLACVGAKPLALTDGMNFGNPEKTDVYWQFRRSVEGIAAGAKAFRTPVISGNVSFYNESRDVPVPPTPIIGMVGAIDNVARSVGIGFRQEGHSVYVLGNGAQAASDLNGSYYAYRHHDVVKTPLPSMDVEQCEHLIACVVQGIEAGVVASAVPVAAGGVATALAKAAALGGVGVECRLSPGDEQTDGEREKASRRDAVLFGERVGSVVVSVAPELEENLRALANRHQVPMMRVGETAGSRFTLTVEAGDDNATIDVDLATLTRAWTGAIPAAMGDSVNPFIDLQKSGR